MAIPKTKVTVCDPKTGKYYRVTLGRDRLLLAQGGQKLLLRINYIGRDFTKLQFQNWLGNGRATEITKEEAESLLPQGTGTPAHSPAIRRAKYKTFRTRKAVNKP